MSHTVRVVLICTLLLDTGPASAARPILRDCPAHVAEGRPATCECRKPEAVPVASVSWGAASSTRILRLPRVDRRHNATVYTCSMVAAGRRSTASYTLNVVYGPESVLVMGPYSNVRQHFPTNGSRSMRLTCEGLVANPAAEVTYTWSSDEVKLSCDGGNEGRVCAFRPQPPADDNKVVTCEARLTCVVTQYIRAERGYYYLNLNYPPSGKPDIYDQRTPNLYGTGDTLHCAVVGGKPLVSAVQFHCVEPAMQDGVDTFTSDRVVSALTVDATRATGKPTVCWCGAQWEDPALYRHNVTIRVNIKYPATVESLTISGRNGVLEVNESRQLALSLHCRAVGQPEPALSLLKSGRLLQEFGPGRFSWLFLNVTCEDMANYTCAAENSYDGQRHVSAKWVQLIVYCAPRLPRADPARPLPRLGPSGRLDVLLVANPAPRSFTWHPRLANLSAGDDDALAGLNVANGSWEASEATRRQFSFECRRKTPELEYVTTCSFRATNASLARGYYAVTLANGLGSLRLVFVVKDSIAQTGRATAARGVSDWVIALVVLGVLLGVLLVAAVAVGVRRRRGAGSGTQPEGGTAEGTRPSWSFPALLRAPWSRAGRDPDQTQTQKASSLAAFSPLALSSALPSPSPSSQRPRSTTSSSAASAAESPSYLHAVGGAVSNMMDTLTAEDSLTDEGPTSRLQRLMGAAPSEPQGSIVEVVFSK